MPKRIDVTHCDRGTAVLSAVLRTWGNVDAIPIGKETYWISDVRRRSNTALDRPR